MISDYYYYYYCVHIEIQAYNNSLFHFHEPMCMVQQYINNMILILQYITLEYIFLRLLLLTVVMSFIGSNRFLTFISVSVA